MDSYPNVKIIGVGGAGGNVIDGMIRANMQDVEFIVFDTDASALARSRGGRKVFQLGESGRRAAGMPDIGRDAAFEARSRIADAIEGAQLVFVVAGMGGGTGTGAAAVITGLAYEMGIPSIALAYMPFSFEGEKRNECARGGIGELRKNADLLIVIYNDCLMEIYGEDNENASVAEAFETLDALSRHVIDGIVGVMYYSSLFSFDFDDIREILKRDGSGEMAMAASAISAGSGHARGRAAATRAMLSPWFGGLDLTDAKCLIAIITGSRSLIMRDVSDALRAISEIAGEDMRLLQSVVMREDMGTDIRVTVVAVGLEMCLGVLRPLFNGSPRVRELLRDFWRDCQ